MALPLIVKRASAFTADVLTNGVVVGRIFKANASPGRGLVDVDACLRAS
jgi:hypothetical protein